MLTIVVTHLISRHALARRYQRCSQWDDASVIQDIKGLMEIQPDASLDKQPCIIRVGNGSWRGEFRNMKVLDDPVAPIITIRTFVER